MPRVPTSAILVALPLLLLGPTAALSASPSEQQCTASGGTYTKETGTATCITNVGASSNSQTSTSTGQGNLSNKSACSGPGSSSTSSFCK